MAVKSMIFIIILSVSAWAAKRPQQASANIRAFWTDSQHISFRMPSDLIMRKDLKFFLHLQTPENFEHELSAYSYSPEQIVLNTSSLDLVLLKKLMSQPLVLDVMSGNFLMLRTGIALGGVLDDLFYTDTLLGQSWSADGVTLRLWSPTASNVRLIFYGDVTETLPMTALNGVWSYRLPLSAKGRYYKFEVTNFFADLLAYQTLNVTDPYSPALSADGKKTLLIDLNDAATQPPGWLQAKVPSALNKDAVIYESHVRDLSANDLTLPARLRGKYLALAEKSSLVYGHLQQLAAVGVTHLHLLPLFDFASVPEVEADQAVLPDHKWSSPDEAPKALERIRSDDNYNWGYDPVHWLAPEGSYATDPDGLSRVYELRKMIMALQGLGLQITQDVVFNHTYTSDFSDTSVLQKIVPFYFYRLTDDGFVAQSSCCSDTASERRMMEKLMADSLKLWIEQYKITSFRFDLMSFHSRETMMRLRDLVRGELHKKFGLLPEQVLIFGEAWPFGSFFEKWPGLAMTQLNSYGSEIGSFNDRFRDAIRGGTTSLSELSDQGLVTGLQDHFNHSPRNQNTPLSENDRLQKFLHLKDVVKIGLAGNLRDFRFVEHLGSTQTGGSIFFKGAPVGYAQGPTESISYVSAHDGVTLWDALQAKLPYHSEWAAPATASLAERVQRHQLALSLVLLSQGVPFIEGGSEILKSKNGDVDSYDSGDFYNALNLDLNTHNWNRALPPQWKNISEWPFWKDRISDKTLTPGAPEIQNTFNFTKTLLGLRKKYSNLKLGTLDKIQSGVRFLDTDVATDPSLLPLLLDQKLLIVWNFSRFEKNWRHPVLNITWTSELGPLPDAGQLVLPPLSLTVLVTHD